MMPGVSTYDDKDGPSKHLVANWMLKLKEGFISRVPETVRVQGKAVAADSLEIKIKYENGKYIATCPMCPVSRSVTQTENPSKLCNSNIFKHFNEHRDTGIELDTNITETPGQSTTGTIETISPSNETIREQSDIPLDSLGCFKVIFFLLR